MSEPSRGMKSTPPSYHFKGSLLNYLTHDEMLACLFALGEPIMLKGHEAYKEARFSARELVMAEISRRKRLCGYDVVKAEECE